MIEPFTARIPQADLDDLQQRLATTRWTHEQPAGRDEGAYEEHLEAVIATRTT